MAVRSYEYSNKNGVRSLASRAMGLVLSFTANFEMKYREVAKGDGHNNYGGGEIAGIISCFPIRKAR